jgi:hypothetical protein
MLAPAARPAPECPGDEQPHRGRGASLSHTRTVVGALALALTTTVLATASAQAATGLVAAYGFNEGTGAAVADASGTGNNGTTSGTTWATGGKFGSALSFNGTSASVTVPDSNSLDLVTGMTLEAWVNPKSIGNAWRTVAFKQTGGGMVYALYANNGAGRPVGQVNVIGEQNAPGTAPRCGCSSTARRPAASRRRAACRRRHCR